MSDRYETHTTPEDWLGAPDPVQNFGSTVERALQQLAQELAGLRAERDGLRLELEGLRTQLDIVRSQLNDRERFTSTVRELGEIVRTLNVPSDWRSPDGFVAPMPPPAVEAPPAPEPAPEPVVVAPVIEPEVAPAPEPEPFVMPVPEPPAPPASEPSPPPAPHTEHEPRWYDPEPTTFTESSTAVETPADDFFAEPGTWFSEPPARTRKRRGTFKTIMTRIGAVIAAVIVAIVLLISVGPKVAPYQTFFVRSGSMEPTFDTGDLIVLGKVDASDIKKGDIITFERPDKPGTLVTHRVVGIETTKDGKQFQTKGDANNTVDSWRVPASGAGWKYKFRIPKAGFVFGYLSTPQARLALLAVPAVLLGLLSLIDIWKPRPKTAPARAR